MAGKKPAAGRSQTATRSKGGLILFDAGIPEVWK